MKLQFKNQQYQSDAAKAVVDIFLSQENSFYTKTKNIILDKGLLSENKKSVIYYGNNDINIDESTIRQNIRKVQNNNKLDNTLDSDFDDKNYYKNFSIEMETGTGKTYTYIKTMYELNKSYGFSKFIVMVPSIAIREGVLKSFQITEEHFKEQYKKKIRYFVYNTSNSSNIANIKQYVEDNNINVIIMNYQAFNTKSQESRKIYEELDELQSRKPIEVIKEVKPILILDEPQKMGNAETLLNEFNPLFILRYSATHKKDKMYNLIYRIDSVDAYNKRLVKKIGVIGCEIVNSKSNDAYIYLSDVNISNNEPKAFIEIEVKSKRGTSKAYRWVKRGDNLYKISKELTCYKGYIVSEIDYTSNVAKIIFSNGKEICKNELIGSIDDKIITKYQIIQTIQTHFKKEEMLFDRGIKVLSLFFIDEVAKYKIYDDENIVKNGEYAEIFEREYNNIYFDYILKALNLDVEKEEDKKIINNIKNIEDVYKYINENNIVISDYISYLLSLDGKKVHSGYFSIDKKKSKKGEDYYFIDSKVNKSGENKGLSDDVDAFDLIMKDKEKLLSFSSPIRFIFSHSALREGWDNPNVFQICTLKKNNSDISKRQEIGRGMRICVNQDGIRQDLDILDSEFLNINKLTVIASESYESFAKSLQDEMIKDSSRKSYEMMEEKHFVGEVLYNDNNKQDTYIITKIDYNKLFIMFHEKLYIDTEGKIQQKIKEDIANDSIVVPFFFEKYKNSYKDLIKKLYTDNSIMIDNDAKTDIPLDLKPNENFKKKEFIELWNKINDITTYEVTFNSEELIEKATKEIDDRLNISSLTTVKITKGEQNEYVSYDDIINNKSLEKGISERKDEDNNIYSNVRYDLIGEISKNTDLTRKTVGCILQKIKREKFEMFRKSPIEFIQKTSNIIDEIKSMTLINMIRYNKANKKYDDNDIWTAKSMCLNGAKLGDHVKKVNKNVFDFLRYDSDEENDFSNELEEAKEVSIYAKLPKSFKISTPFGNYSPDWALCFNDKKFKYIYFIAETKKSIESIELRPIEKAKIECAKKHFKCIFDTDNTIDYKEVSTYNDLYNILIKEEI